MSTKSKYTKLRNEVIDMQNAIIGWRKELAYDSEDDLISELERMISEALEARTSSKE